MFKALVLVALPVLASASFSMLYAMSGDTAVPSRTFEIINAESGKVIETGRDFTHDFDAQGLSTIDTNRGIFYFIGRNLTANTISLVGVSTDTGNVLGETPLPFWQEPFIGVGEFCDANSKTGAVYVCGRSASGDNTHELWSVDPFTHKKKMIANVGDKSHIALLGGSSAFDAKYDIEWVQLARNDSGRILIRLYGYDVKSGLLWNALDDEYGFGAMEFDTASGLIYGIGAKEVKGTLVLMLVTLDSATTQYHEIGALSGYTSYMAAEMGMNSRARKVYLFMTKDTPKNAEYVGKGLTRQQAAEAGMSFSIVTIDLDTGKVLHDAPYCTTITGCPWSIEYQ